MIRRISELTTLLLVVVSLVFVACGNTSSNNQLYKYDCEIVAIDSDVISEGNLTEICDSVCVIRLDNCKPYTGERYREMAMVSGDYIFIQYSSNNQSGVDIYNWQGEYIATLARRGRGPGEYLYISNIHYDKENQRLILNDHTLKKVLSYNVPHLDCVEEMNMESSLGVFCCHNGLIYGVKTVDGEYGKCNVGVFEKQSFRVMDLPTTRLSYTSEIPSLVSTETHLTYTYNNGYSLVMEVVQGAQPQELFVLDYGKNALNLDGIDTKSSSYNYQVISAFQEGKHSGLTHNVMWNGRKLQFNFIKENTYNGQAYGVYDSQSGQVRLYSKLQIPGISQQIIPCGTYKDFFVSLIIPEACQVKESEVSDFIGDKVLEELRAAENSTEICHPLVLLYRLK